MPPPGRAAHAVHARMQQLLPAGVAVEYGYIGNTAVGNMVGFSLSYVTTYALQRAARPFVNAR